MPGRDWSWRVWLPRGIVVVIATSETISTRSTILSEAIDIVRKSQSYVLYASTVVVKI